MYSLCLVDKHSCCWALFVLSQPSPQVQQPEPCLNSRFPQRLQPRGRWLSVHKVSECNIRHGNGKSCFGILHWMTYWISTYHENVPKTLYLYFKCNLKVKLSFTTTLPNYIKRFLHFLQSCIQQQRLGPATSAFIRQCGDWEDVGHQQEIQTHPCVRW